MQRTLITLAILTAGSIGSSAFANNIFMNINFNGDTFNSAPGTNTTINNPITQPYSIGGYSDATLNPFGDSPPTPQDGTVLVQNPDGMNQAAVLTSAFNNDQEGAVYMDTEYNISSQIVNLSFDVDILAQPPAATVQPKTLNGGPATVGILLGVNNFQSGSTGFDFAAAPTAAGGGIFGIRSPDNDNLVSFFNYSDHTVYNVDLVANYTTGTLNAYVNGALEAANLPIAAGIVPNANPDETFFFLNGEPGFSNSVALDNIVADTSSVPLPKTAWAGAGLMLGLIVWRLRRRAQLHF